MKLLRHFASWKEASTGAIPNMNFPASAVPTVGRSGSSCSPAAAAASAPPAMPRGWRSGASGCGKSFSWMSPTARSSSPSPGCYGYFFKSASASSWGNFARRPSALFSNTSWPKPTQNSCPLLWSSSSRSDRRSIFTPRPPLLVNEGGEQ